MTTEHKYVNSHRRKKRSIKVIVWSVTTVTLVLVAIAGLLTINISPFRAFGGALWLKDGVHYLNNEDINKRIGELNAPKEVAMADYIAKNTPSCKKLEDGFCTKGPDEYVYKSLMSAAVMYKPGTPDRKEIIGYCTACNDGTFSPSCAVGRGACSWHSGVAAYNVPEYRTIYGTPAVKAQPAVYNYEPKYYTDSPLYVSPETPSLNVIVGQVPTGDD